MTLAPTPDDTTSIRARNRARILAAAEHVFADKGFTGATTAEIAALAGLPKPNVHYYFPTKRDLYVAVLADILAAWLDPLRVIGPDDDPATAVATYVRAKMRASWARPQASKVFANEIIHGAEQVMPFLADDLRTLLDDKVQVLEGWIAAGHMAPLAPRPFFFMIWAMTQYYADFDAQTKALIGTPDQVTLTGDVVRLVLRAAGLDASGKEAG